jgi:uncharacterized protein (DUF39 family)
MIQHFTFTTVAAVTIEASSETEARTLLRHSAQYQENDVSYNGMGVYLPLSNVDHAVL